MNKARTLAQWLSRGGNSY